MSLVCLSNYIVLHYSSAYHILLLMHLGGLAVHSYGRLIPHEFPITDLQQISGPDGLRIHCTISSGTASFASNGGELEAGGVYQIGSGLNATLIIPSDVSSFQNRGLYCTAISTNFFYLFISSASKCTSLQMHIVASYVHNQQCICIYNVVHVTRNFYNNRRCAVSVIRRSSEESSKNFLKCIVCLS